MIGDYVERSARRRAKVEAESEAPSGTLEGSTPSITARAILYSYFFFMFIYVPYFQRTPVTACVGLEAKGICKFGSCRLRTYHN